MANETLIAWAAGVIDGEGHIGVSRWRKKKKLIRGGMAGKLPKQTHVARVSVEMTHKPTLFALREIFDAGSVSVRQRLSKDGRFLYRKQWKWQVCGWAVKDILEQLLPYLVTKKKEAEILLKIFRIPKLTQTKEATKGREKIALQLQAHKMRVGYERQVTKVQTDSWVAAQEELYEWDDLPGSH